MPADELLAVLPALDDVIVIERPFAGRDLEARLSVSMGQISGSTNFSAKTGLCECARDNVYLLCARKNHHPRGWRLSEVRKSEPNGARGL
jgi:hypothetical protein